MQLGQPTARGLAVADVVQSGLFFNSGLRRGDVLVSLNGRPLRTQADFVRWVSYYPGQRVPIIVLREGRPQTIYITYDMRQFAPTGIDPQVQQLAQAYLGVTFDVRYRNAAIVQSVAPGSPAEQAGLRPGDALNSLGGRRVMSPIDVVNIISSMQPGQRVDLGFSRRAAVVLAGRQQPMPYSAAYPPQPAPPQVDVVSPPVGAMPIAPNPAYSGTTVRPGDADRDGRRLDGDGRARRRR